MGGSKLPKIIDAKHSMHTPNYKSPSQSVTYSDSKEKAPPSSEALPQKDIKQLVTEQFTKNTWDKECVAIAVAAKAKKYAIKGIPLNCFVLDRGKDDKTDEFVKFVNLLRDNLRDIENNTRFQLAIQTGSHWTACDVLIVNHSPIIFVLDAVHIGEAIKSICNVFLKTVPTTKVYVYHPDEIPNPKDPFNPKERRIQFDEENCSSFTLDHIFRLSIVDVFKEFKDACIKGVKSSPNSFFRINPKNCPPNLAFIFEHIQSLDVLNSLPDAIKQKTIPSYTIGGASLFKQVNFNTDTVNIKKDGKEIQKNINFGIVKTKKRLASEAKEYLDLHTNNEISSVLANRTGFKFLTDVDYRKLATTPSLTDLNYFKSIDFLIEMIIIELFDKIQTIDSSKCFKVMGNDLRELLDVSNEIIFYRDDPVRLRQRVLEGSFTEFTQAFLIAAFDNLESQKPRPITEMLNIFKVNLNAKFSLLEENSSIELKKNMKKKA